MRPNGGKGCVVTDAGQPSSPAAQESPPRRRQTWVQGRKKAEEAERRKLRSHIEVLQDRARRFCENGPAPAAELVNALLSQPVVDVVREQVDYGDMESAHEYADKLEELLPLIVDDAYLRAVLTYELVGGDPDEPIKLSRVTDNAALWESLSLLYKIRADRLRHERLMAKLRGAYLPYSAGLIVIVLVLLALAILSGEIRRMPARSPGGPSWSPSEPPERSAASWRRHSNSETPSS